MASCINCEQETNGNFCANCGQRTHVKRITFREGWNDFWARIYGFDGMLPNTLRDLTIRPGKATQLFLQGNRVKYYGPVGYFFLMVTLLVLVLDILGIELDFYLTKLSQASLSAASQTGKGQEKFSQIFTEFVADNFRWVAFIQIPFQAFCARFIFFKKSGLNYVEHTVLPFYVQGHIQWTGILNVIYYKCSGVFANNLLISTIQTLFFCYAYSNFISYQSKWKSFFKAFGLYSLSLFIFILILLILLLLLIKFNPQVYEMIKPSNNRSFN